MDSKIVLAIPGPWENQSQLVSNIAMQFSDAGYLYAGMIMMHSASGLAWEVNLQEGGPEFVEAFRIASQGKVEDATLEEVASHRSIAVCSSMGPGTADLARATHGAGCAILGAGGTGVMVSSAGVAHSPQTWREMQVNSVPFDLYRAYVTLVGDRDVYYSCGMHNLGLPDAHMPTRIPPDQAAELLNIFHSYNLIENPGFESGHSFSFGDSPHFQLQHIQCTRFEPDDPYYNPHGIWNLSLPRPTSWASKLLRRNS